MKNTVNIAVQVLPVSKTIDTYTLVDKAIEVIANSGLKYQVTPFETVIEGSYDEIMQVVKEAQEACYTAGADSIMTYLKIQSAISDVSIEHKMEKYK